MIDAHMPKRHFDNAPTTAQDSKIFCSAAAAAVMSCLCFDFGFLRSTLLSLAIYGSPTLSVQTSLQLQKDRQIRIDKI